MKLYIKRLVLVTTYLALPIASSYHLLYPFLGFLFLVILVSGMQKGFNVWKTQWNKPFLRASIFYFICLLLVFFLSFKDISDIKTIVEFLVGIFVAVYAMNENWKACDWVILKNTIKIGISISAVAFVVMGFPTLFQSVYVHPNTMGTICFLSIVILTLPGFRNAQIEGEHNWQASGRFTIDSIFVILSLILLLFSGSRSSILSVIVYFSIVYASKKLGDNKNFFRFLFASLAVLIIVFVIVYPNLYRTEIGNKINELSRRFMNKNFFSGRQYGWLMIYTSLRGHELFGLGLGIHLPDIADVEYSSSNTYLQAYLQGGFVNVGAMILLIVAVFDTLLNSKNRQEKYYYVAFLSAICIHECFEISLFQNQPHFSVAIWLLLGLMMKSTNRDQGELQRETNRKKSLI